VGCAGTGPISTQVTRAERAARVRTEFLHAWRGYERYAWGSDELKPLRNTARDSYGESLLITPVDALDKLIMMGLRYEAERAKA